MQIKKGISLVLAAVLAISFLTIPAGAREALEDGRYELPVKVLQLDSNKEAPAAKLLADKAELTLDEGVATLAIKARSSDVSALKYCTTFGDFDSMKKAAEEGQAFSFALPYAPETNEDLCIEFVLDNEGEFEQEDLRFRLVPDYSKTTCLESFEKTEEESEELEQGDISKETKPSKPESAPELTEQTQEREEVQALDTKSDGTEVDTKALNKDKLKDGTYEIQTAVYHESKAETSMCDGVFNGTARITVKNGKKTMRMWSHPMSISGMTATLKGMKVNGKSVKVVSRVSGNEISSFSFPLTSTNEFIPAVVSPYSADFEPMNTDFDVRIKMNYSTLKQTKASNSEPKNTKAKKDVSLNTLQNKTSLADRAKTSKETTASGTNVQTGDGFSAAPVVIALLALFALLAHADSRKAVEIHD